MDNFPSANPSLKSIWCLQHKQTQDINELKYEKLQTFLNKKQSRSSMVDSDFFTEFNKFLIIEQNRILLDYKNCDYTLELLFSNEPCKKIPKVTSNNFIKKVPIKAVYGVIEMQVNNYLVVVTKASVIGQIYHRKIFQIQKVQFFCLAHKQSSQDKIYIKGLQQMFSTKYFYFSDQYDLTNSLQAFINANCSMKNKRLSYMYNSDWVDDFVKVKAYEWITGFISGFVVINFTHTGLNNSCEVALVSRRDKRRQGKRWITRGCDFDGYTANTAETQLIFLTENGGKENVFSHVQLRGSMPFFWDQDPDLKWSPKVNIHANDKLNLEVAKKNYEDIKQHYDNCTLVNLIDKKGSQKRLGEYFQKVHRQISDQSFKLIWFDFHHECRKMRYQNLAQLMDLMDHELENYGYFHMELTKNSSERASKKNSQKGVFRTNCMDCLDRTNVVQSVISRHLLLSWLIKLNIMTKSKNGGPFERLPQHLEEIFRNQWTKNADIISILYSGTPAMKTDFTATGKRTWKGSLKDGYNGVKRFFLGNFYDNRDQDFIDFSLGKLKPKKSEKMRIRHSKLNAMYLIAIFLIAIPFLVNHQVDQFYQTIPGEGQLQQEQSLWPIKFGGSLLAILVTAKMFQLFNTAMVRQPILKQNP